MATTKVEPKAASAGATRREKNYEGLSPEQLIEIHRLMLLSRRIDDREMLLKRQQKAFFQISCAGHEALLVAAGKSLKPAHDWFYPYYRDRALCLALGMTPLEQLLASVGSADDPSSGGRQMPSHWGNKKLNIIAQSSATGTQFVEAVGCAEAGRYFNRHPKAAGKVEGDYRQFKDVEHYPDELVYVSGGEGTTSEGEFWEAMNTASNRRLPVLFVIEDNEYAISVPVEVQTPGGNISRLVANFPNFHFEECDGCDVLASYAAMQRAVGHIRAGKGPGFVHGHVIRPYSHSLSDDEKLYRPESERRAEAERDPILRFRNFLLREGILDEKALGGLEKLVENEVQQASDRALEAPIPARDSYTDFVYSPHLDATSSAFDARAHLEVEQEGHARSGVERTMAELINLCLRDELKRDPRVVVFGQDVADCSREQYLADKSVKGKGGVFKVTAGLQVKYGSERVFNSLLAEASIIGRAIGMATRGLKPVVEIQFFDYIWPAMHQLRNEMPLLRWRSNGAFSCPLVVRVPIGGYLGGGSIYHSQSGESIFTHTPGVRIVFPSNALDAAGLLRTAVRCDDPVMFLEHKRLYRESYGRSAYPGPDFMVPFGKAKTILQGSDLTVVTYGATVPRALQAAARLEREHGIKPEILDLRTLSPYDWEAIATSVTKTNRVLVLHEDMLSWGYGAEIAARIAQDLFHDLDAPVRRLAGKDTFVAYHPLLEDVILPQPEDIFLAMLDLARY